MIIQIQVKCKSCGENMVGDVSSAESVVLSGEHASEIIDNTIECDNCGASVFISARVEVD